jgi:hypothetical protein
MKLLFSMLLFMFVPFSYAIEMGDTCKVGQQLVRVVKPVDFYDARKVYVVHIVPNAPRHLVTKRRSYFRSKLVCNNADRNHH